MQNEFKLLWKLHGDQVVRAKWTKMYGQYEVKEEEDNETMAVDVSTDKGGEEEVAMEEVEKSDNQGEKSEEPKGQDKPQIPSKAELKVNVDDSTYDKAVETYAKVDKTTYRRAVETFMTLVMKPVIEEQKLKIEKKRREKAKQREEKLAAARAKKTPPPKEGEEEATAMADEEKRDTSPVGTDNWGSSAITDMKWNEEEEEEKAQPAQPIPAQPPPDPDPADPNTDVGLGTSGTFGSTIQSRSPPADPAVSPQHEGEMEQLVAVAENNPGDVAAADEDMKSAPVSPDGEQKWGENQAGKEEEGVEPLAPPNGQEQNGQGGGWGQEFQNGAPKDPGAWGASSDNANANGNGNGGNEEEMPEEKEEDAWSSIPWSKEAGGKQWTDASLVTKSEQDEEQMEKADEEELLPYEGESWEMIWERFNKVLWEKAMREYVRVRRGLWTNGRYIETEDDEVYFKEIMVEKTIKQMLTDKEDKLQKEGGAPAKKAKKADPLPWFEVEVEMKVPVAKKDEATITKELCLKFGIGFNKEHENVRGTVSYHGDHGLELKQIGVDGGGGDNASGGVPSRILRRLVERCWTNGILVNVFSGNGAHVLDVRKHSKQKLLSIVMFLYINSLRRNADKFFQCVPTKTR